MANRKNITIKKLKQNQTEKGNRVSLLALQRLNEDKRYKYVHNDFKKSKKSKYYQNISCISHRQIAFNIPYAYRGKVA